ncbi:Protein kinase protein with adenine nucleotide alpha hydrolases-like domain [Prunus dulcis]|uniref:Protein kinase protein with adenine nucleotide alpha hydrolases-like domain n=1 Tax=Prunus dulcis TaxID=3755 RepID=A0A4Y1QSJ1_PRUDU|nr:Protein kinase protein with adenine nucleotide alpha hydrolases-like domain [Prunus dulcis]
MVSKKEKSQKKSGKENHGEWLCCDLAETLAIQTTRTLKDDNFGINQYKVKEEALLSSTCPLKIELPAPESTLGWPLQRLTVPSMSQEAPPPERELCDLKGRDVDESPLSRPGWPLLRIGAISEAAMSPIREFKAREKKSVAQWVMDLPSRSFSVNQQPQVDLILRDVEYTTERQSRCYDATNGDENCLSVSSRKLARNLIGEGGCSSVYRACLGDGKPVAVKILKSYKEAWDDFFLEAKFVSSIQHKHITSLIGVCAEGGNLILVYDLFPRGSLEGNLHGCSDGSIVLPWEVRFNVAVAVAEALNYLHNECPPPIIHRDVKSSNILLSDELLPQLSDFGLAMWGSTDSAYVISSDVVGTFGYIAPEYFMHGMVSDKIDVYAFGVVLLELLSGRKPVDAGAPKGQESLVKWARHLLDSMDLKALLDPNLNGDYNDIQMRRMVLAAGLCINQSPRLRPKVSQILQLLTGETDADKYFDSHAMESREDDNDDLFLEIDCKSHSVSAMSDTNDGSRSSSSTDTASSVEKIRRYKLKDHLTIRDHYSLSEIFLLS